MAPEEKKDSSLAPVQNSTSSASGDDRVFLENWKFSLGLFLLGLLCGVALGRLSGYVEFLWVVDLILVPVYALWIYPSLFTDKPVLKSRGLVSFLNGFVGGIIFGAIWSSNLTKRNRGISHYVCVALLGAAVIALFCFYLMGAGGTNVSATSKSSSAASKPPSAQSIRVGSSYVGTWQLAGLYSDVKDQNSGVSAGDAQRYDEITITSNGNLTYTKKLANGKDTREMYLDAADTNNEFYVVDKHSGKDVGYVRTLTSSETNSISLIFFPVPENDGVQSAWIFNKI